ncbi:hypothetical protein ACVMBZ_007075 [Bradyrhizobium liaoningense]
MQHYRETLPHPHPRTALRDAGGAKRVLEALEENWASKRIHGSTRRQVEAMFQEEKPHLRPLPVAPFRIFTEVVRTVCDDTTVRVDNSYYAARPAPIGSQVVVRIYTTTIEIRDRHTRALLRVHSRMAHPGSVVLPTSERPFNPSRQTAVLLASAERIGPQTRALCQQVFDTEGRPGQRAMWGIVGWAGSIRRGWSSRPARTPSTTASTATSTCVRPSSGCSNRRSSRLE